MLPCRCYGMCHGDEDAISLLPVVPQATPVHDHGDKVVPHPLMHLLFEHRGGRCAPRNLGLARPADGNSQHAVGSSTTPAADDMTSLRQEVFLATAQFAMST